MRVLIIEDEQPAARRLQNFLQEYPGEIEVLDVLDSISSSIMWFKENPDPDLVFLDIHLADGASFEIFNHVELEAPVIFTTAYDDYAIKAFQLNSIAYLLKPFKQEDLYRSIEKLETLKQTLAATDSQLLQRLVREVSQGQKSYKSRFLIKMGSRLMSLQVKDVAYFYAEEKLVYVHTQDDQKFVLDFTLEELENVLDPNEFFRLNRKVIAHISSISSIHNHFNGKLKLHLQPVFPQEVLVSREKASTFKSWMDS